MKTDLYRRPPRSLPIGYRMAGVLILLALIAVACAGCSGEEHHTMHWTADDGLEHYR